MHDFRIQYDRPLNEWFNGMQILLFSGISQFYVNSVYEWPVHSEMRGDKDNAYQLMQL